MHFFSLNQKHMQHRLKFVHSAELQASFVELKYADSKFSFVIALPTATSTLRQLESRIKHVNLADILSQMKLHGLTLSLPKFKVEFDIELKDVLTKVTKFIWHPNCGGGK